MWSKTCEEGFSIPLNSSCLVSVCIAKRNVLRETKLLGLVSGWSSVIVAADDV